LAQKRRDHQPQAVGGVGEIRGGAPGGACWVVQFMRQPRGDRPQRGETLAGAFCIAETRQHRFDPSHDQVKHRRLIKHEHAKPGRLDDRD
jgi:hypothetical protein